MVSVGLELSTGGLDPLQAQSEYHHSHVPQSHSRLTGDVLQYVMLVASNTRTQSMEAFEFEPLPQNY